MPVDIIIYAVVALGLGLWLRSILGTRHGGEQSRPNPFSVLNGTDAPARPPIAAAGLAAGKPGDPRGGLERNMAITGARTDDALLAIAKADRGFDPVRFIRGSQDAFVMIVEAYAAGDRKILRDLLNDRVYQAFESSLSQREARGEKASVEIHAVRRLELTDAALADKIASITVRFVADETYVVRDKDDKIISGNPDRVTEAVDVWVFSRDLRAKAQVWLVSETLDADQVFSDKK